MRSALLVATCSAAIAPTVVSGTALAGPESEVASAFDPGDPFDLHVTVDYHYAARSAAIEREFVGLPGADPDGGMPRVPDLVFSEVRHEIIPRLSLGVFHDLALTAALPIVVQNKRSLEFDQRQGDCTFDANPDTARCIDASNSTTVADGLLPADGYDATTGVPIGDGTTAFRGSERSGFDQLHLGVVWAPMNQARDATKPTWKLGVEWRAPVGETMQHRRSAGATGDATDDAVGRGIYELRFATSVARRLSWAEPYFEIWYQAAVATKEGAPLESPAQAFGAQQTGPQQVAGGRFGFEAIAWESTSSAERIGLRFEGLLEAHFEGRGYSDMWEVFALAGESPGTPLALESDPVAPGPQVVAHPGVTNIENYLRLGGQISGDAHLGRGFRLNLGFRALWEQAHAISFADAGVDGSDAGEDVTPDTAEVNPLHAAVIDAPGHRYRVSDVLDYVVTVGIRALF